MALIRCPNCGVINPSNKPQCAACQTDLKAKSQNQTYTMPVSEAPPRPPEESSVPLVEFPNAVNLTAKFANKYLRKKAFQYLFLLALVPCVTLGVGVIDPKTFVQPEYELTCQILCGIGTIIWIVAAALLYLWLEKVLGLR